MFLACFFLAIPSGEFGRREKRTCSYSGRASSPFRARQRQTDGKSDPPTGWRGSFSTFCFGAPFGFLGWALFCSSSVNHFNERHKSGSGRSDFLLTFLLSKAKKKRITKGMARSFFAIHARAVSQHMCCLMRLPGSGDHLT